MYKYDVIVIGCGFAGSEAAMASARGGAKTLMIAINMDSIATMPFGNILGNKKYREVFIRIEKYGSMIPGNIKKNSLIEIKRGKYSNNNIAGSIVIDKKRYSLKMKELIENTENLGTRQGLVTDIIIKEKSFEIITSDYLKFTADAIVLCTGTFLNSRIFWGENIIEGGRPGEIRSLRLKNNLIKKGFKFTRKCIFAAPEIKKRTINVKNVNIKCIRDKGIEYFVVFPGEVFTKVNTGKEIKNLYIIPDGIDSDEMYMKGFENSLSEDMQTDLIRKLEGFENAFITRPGYGIEYGCLSPFQINETLESIKIRGLFFAGRINRTNKYEQSLEQGLLAGINACKKVKGIEMVNSI